MFNRVFNKAVALIMIILLATSGAGAAFAAVDVDRPCTLEIITITDEGEGIDGFKVALFKVASLDAAGVYTFTDEFKDAGFTIEEFTEAEVREDMIRTLEKYALDNNLEAEYLTTNEDGVARYSDKDCGIYLFINTERTGSADEYYEFIPGVIFAPTIGEDAGNYTAQAFPKIEIITGGGDDEDGDGEDPKDPPKTGDDSNIELWTAMMYVSIGCVVVFGAFVILCGKKEDDSVEEAV